MKLKTSDATTKSRQGRKKLVPNQHRKRGQVMALGCLTMLLLALSLMMSFSVSNVVHERIRIQSHADAMAFSMAVIEARAMNYLAYSNRALAAAFVSMTTVHAYGAAVTSAVSLMRAVQVDIGIGIPLHVVECVASWGTSPCCWHAIQLGIRVAQYQQTIQNYQQQVQSAEQPFNDTVQAFARLANNIHASQQSMVRTTRDVIQSGTDNNFDNIRQINAPCAAQGISGNAGNLNVRNFACAMEGSVLDGQATGCSGPSELNERRRIMSNVVNASRPNFLNSTHIPFTDVSGTAFGPPIFNRGQFVTDLVSTVPQPEISHLGLGYRIDGWLTDNANGCQDAAPGSRGNASCARAGDNTVFAYIPYSSCMIPGGFIAGNAFIASNEGGSNHSPAHTSQHQEYRGLFAGDAGQPCMDGNCFINHRLDTQQRNWGQPAVYSCITQDLRESTTPSNACNRPPMQPWELNQQRTVTIQHGQRGQGQLRLSPNQQGFAASKALVYFHRMDDWRFPPNLFDPYWRAKLHPFESDGELGTVGCGQPQTFI